MNKLSVVIIAKNEEANIERCLKSCRFADEIILLDTGSSDDTVAIAKRLGAKVFYLDKWEGFGKAKRHAVSLSTHDWVLSVDSDEVISDDLQSKIIEILANPKFNLYKIKRKSYYLGKIINYCGWQNDYPKRLFNKNVANFNDSVVHESVVGTKEIGTIEEFIYHYTYITIASHIEKINFYTELAVSEKTVRASSVFTSILRGFAKFIKMYFIQLGILDGKQGLILSFVSSFGVTVKYLKIHQKQRESIESQNNTHR